MAMVASDRLQRSIGVGAYTNGFDPSNASIPNLSIDWDDQYRRLAINGFTSELLGASAFAIGRILREYGPFILSHLSQGFPYGPGVPIKAWGKDDCHAVVITGEDSDLNGGTCWMNNPWGYKDMPIRTSAVVNALNSIQASGIKAVAYWRR